MKSISKFLPAIIIVGFAFASCSPYSSCDKWRMGVYSRGAEDIAFNPGTEKKVATTKPPKSRGETEESLVTVWSKTSHVLNIYVDTVWQGTLDPSEKGYLNVESGEFDYMHAISIDGQFIWAGKGGSEDKYSFEIED